MNRQSILFRGLPIHKSPEVSFLAEESFYMGSAPVLQDAKEKYADITYFLIYAMCRNLRCRSKIRDMKKEWMEYLRKQAEKSVYQGSYFWYSLNAEEIPCAKIVLGMLEDIRNSEEEQAERSWISFWYLLKYGFWEEYETLKKQKIIDFQEICCLEARYGNWQSLGLSRICVCFAIAEDVGAIIRENGNYGLLFSCIRKESLLWESGREQEKKIKIMVDKKKNRVIISLN